MSERIRPIRLGIFGNGFIAGVHAEALSQLPEVAVVGVCGPRADAVASFASRHQIQHAVTDPDALLGISGLDGVLVDAPDGFHYDLVMRAVAAQKHIFCEKPLAVTVEQAREMYEAARTAGLRTVVGFSSRWSTVLANVRKLIEDDRLGNIAHVHAQSFNPSLIRTARPRFTWRTDAARTGTGILGDLGAHYIDLTHFLVGDIVEVCADVQTIIPETYDDQGNARSHLVDDDTTLLFRLASGAHGSLSLSRLGSVHSNYPVGRRHYLIDGRKGGILFENGQAWLFRPDQPGELIPGDPPRAGVDHHQALLEGAARQMTTFVQAIREDRDQTPNFRDGLKCQEVLHAAVESSRTRSWHAVARVD